MIGGYIPHLSMEIFFCLQTEIILFFGKQWVKILKKNSPRIRAFQIVESVRRLILYQ